MINGLSFISWSEFSDSCDYLPVRDRLHTCHEGTYIVVKKFRRVCRELVSSVSVPMKTTTASVPTKPLSDSVLTSVSVASGASVRSKMTSNAVPTKSISVSVPTQASW